jgi:hypothetical protein
LFLLGQIVGVKANRFCLDTSGHPATTMAKRLASSQSQLLYSFEASVADSASEFELDVDASSSAGSEPVTATRRQQRSRVEALRYRSTLPEASEKALVSILLDPVLQRQKPEIVYKGQESLFGEPKSSLRKAVENRRRYICSRQFGSQKFAALVSSLGLTAAESNAALQPDPAIIESDDTLPYAGKMQSPPRFIRSPGGSRSGTSNGCKFHSP